MIEENEIEHIWETIIEIQKTLIQIQKTISTLQNSHIFLQEHLGNKLDEKLTKERDC
jgi:hypothetical protein